MALKDLILQFHKDLKAYNINLMAITLNGFENLEKELINKRETFLAMTETGQKFFSDGQTDILLYEYPFKVQYVHDPLMSREYFFGWRPAFRTINHLFQDPIGAEVGAFEGFLTDQVLKYVKPSKHYLIDQYKVYDDIISELGGFTQDQWDGIYKSVCFKYKDTPNVEIIKKDSVEAAKDFKDESLDYVYIDADHTQDTVYKDICAWYPKVKSGGFVSGHDYRDASGVKNGVWKFLIEKLKIHQEQDWKTDFYSETNDWWFRKC